MIYLDSASSHPLLPQVRQALIEHWQEYEGYGENPSAAHRVGRKLKQECEQWQQQLAQTLGIAPKEWIWLSGATEANNLAIKTASLFYDEPTFFVHPYAHASLKAPLQLHGLPAQTLPLLENGLVDTQEAERMVAPYLPNAVLLWPYGDNEWGFFDAPTELWEHWHDEGAWLHFDAAQSFAKMPLNLRTLPCQSLTTSGHKFGALAGIGGLYLRLRPKKICEPLIAGGGQQGNWRSGTIPCSLIKSFIVAFDCWERQGLRQKLAQNCALFESLLPTLQAFDTCARSPQAALPYLYLLRCLKKDLDLSQKGPLAQELCYSQGSACQSIHDYGSPALEARGFNKEEQAAFMRISLSPLLEKEQIERAIALLINVTEEQ